MVYAVRSVIGNQHKMFSGKMGFIEPEKGTRQN